MNGEWYSTIHVTPEDGYSYASFECVGSTNNGMEIDVAHVFRKVIQIFRPGTMSVSITSAGGDLRRRVVSAVEAMGFKRRSCATDEFPEAVHPCCPAILNRIEKWLDLLSEKLTASRRALKDYRNASTNTIVYVLEYMLEEGNKIRKDGGDDLKLDIMLLLDLGSLLKGF
ncbi:hypothetical protein HN51_034709 [Arachis hypogaea]